MRTLNLTVLLIFLLLSSSTPAAVITVNTGSDPIDISWQTATIADLPGPDGKISFSEAMIAADNTPGHDTILFNIPQSEWEMQWLYPGQPVIFSSYSYFWNASEAVTIDGTSQTEFTGDTNPDGWELIFYQTFSNSGIGLGGEGSVFRGVHGGSVSLGGSNALAEDNSGGINIDVGGTGAVVRNNVCGTIKTQYASNCTITGNQATRVRVLYSENVTVGGPEDADGNIIAGYSYVNSEGLPSGTLVQIAGSSGTLVQNNRIGTTPDGMEQGGLHTTIGVGLEAENHGTIIRDNEIAGILGLGMGPHWPGTLWGWGVLVSGSGSDLLIERNTIGLDAAGEPTLGSVWGIDVGNGLYASLSNIQILDNVVAGHRINGITIGRNLTGVRLQRNLVYANDDLGIDLIPQNFGYGVTPNDILDGDTGANGLQNYPVLTMAESAGNTVFVEGSLQSTPGNIFTLEFFASEAAHASGFGEGQEFLGAIEVMTDGSGMAGFDGSFPVAVDAGWVVTATGTLEPSGSTSEFGPAQPLAPRQASAVDEGPLAWVPTLGQPWPNPANPRISVELALPRSGHQLVRIVDLAGRVMATLVNDVLPQGSHVLTWDGVDAAGRAAPSGLYFISAEGASESVRRFTLVR
jgi:hypothetical protein